MVTASAGALRDLSLQLVHQRPRALGARGLMLRALRALLRRGELRTERGQGRGVLRVLRRGGRYRSEMSHLERETLSERPRVSKLFPERPRVPEPLHLR